MEGAISSVSDYEKKQIEAIQKYENQEPSVAAQAMDFVMAPIGWLVNQVIPESAIEGAIRGSDWLAQQTIDETSVIKTYGVTGLHEIRSLALRKLDEDADSVHNWAVGVAAGEGGAAGWFGILSAPVDVPFTISLALRTIRRIGLSYGYSISDELERQFVLGILSEAGANNQAQKAAALATLRALQVQLVRQAWKGMAQRAAANRFSRDGAMIAIRELAKQLGVNLTKRKALAAIPVLGAGVGACVNAVYVGDIGWAARRAYQRRWLMDNGRWLEG